MDLSSALTHQSTGDEGYDIFLSNPSAFSLHQIEHIHGSGARPSVAAMGRGER
jgi:hypothetical protein